MIVELQRKEGKKREITESKDDSHLKRISLCKFVLGALVEGRIDCVGLEDILSLCVAIDQEHITELLPFLEAFLFCARNCGEELKLPQSVYTLDDLRHFHVTLRGFTVLDTKESYRQFAVCNEVSQG